MGSSSSSILTEDILEEYTLLTYLSKAEILNLYKQFSAVDEKGTLQNLTFRFPSYVIEHLFPQLKYNPFKDRIFRVFSSQKDDKLSFEDMLDLCSVMSEKCPEEVKATWAFRIFDFDEDNAVGEDDLMEVISRLTGAAGYIDVEHKEHIIQIVEMDFVVPFIKIPVKRSLDMAKGALANINLGALAIAGFLTFIIAVALPTISMFVNKKLSEFPTSPGFSTHFNKSYKDSDPSSSEIWRYLTILDNVLMENNVDSTSCVQRMICWTVKKSSINVNNGKGTSIDKILDGIATSGWLQNYVSNTPFYSALKNGLNDVNCNKEYDKCRVTQRTINVFVKSFVKIINGR